MAKNRQNGPAQNKQQNNQYQQKQQNPMQDNQDRQEYSNKRNCPGGKSKKENNQELF